MQLVDHNDGNNDDRIYFSGNDVGMSRKVIRGLMCVVSLSVSLATKVARLCSLSSFFRQILLHIMYVSFSYIYTCDTMEAKEIRRYLMILQMNQTAFVQPN